VGWFRLPEVFGQLSVMVIWGLEMSS